MRLEELNPKKRLKVLHETFQEEIKNIEQKVKGITDVNIRNLKVLMESLKETIEKWE